MSCIVGTVPLSCFVVSACATCSHNTVCECVLPVETPWKTSSSFPSARPLFGPSSKASGKPILKMTRSFVTYFCHFPLTRSRLVVNHQCVIFAKFCHPPAPFPRSAAAKIFANVPYCVCFVPWGECSRWC